MPSVCCWACSDTGKPTEIADKALPDTYIGRMRSLLLIASAVGAGLAFGRKYLERGVSAQKDRTIQSAAAETRRRIKRHADDFLRKSFRSFAISTGIKLLILGVLWGLAHGGVMVRPHFVWSVTGVLALFLVRDIWVTWPFVRLGMTELARHGWHPKRALGEVIAGHVFQQVLAEAQSVPSTRSSKVLLMLAGQSREGFEHDIATAVATIARDASWTDLRPFLVSAGIKTSALMLIYSASVFLIMAS